MEHSIFQLNQLRKRAPSLRESSPQTIRASGKRKENGPSRARLACYSKWRACLLAEGRSIFPFLPAVEFRTSATQATVSV